MVLGRGRGRACVPHTLSAQTRTARSRGGSAALPLALAAGPPSLAPSAARAAPDPSSPEPAQAGSRRETRASAPDAAAEGGVAAPGASTQGVGPRGAPRGPARGQSAELTCGRQPLQPLSVQQRLAWLQAGLPGAAAHALALPPGLSGAALLEPAQASPAWRTPAGSGTTSGVRIDGAVTRMTPASPPQAHWVMPCNDSLQ